MLVTTYVVLMEWFTSYFSLEKLSMYYVGRYIVHEFIITIIMGMDIDIDFGVRNKSICITYLVFSNYSPYGSNYIFDIVDFTKLCV